MSPSTLSWKGSIALVHWTDEMASGSCCDAARQIPLGVPAQVPEQRFHYRLGD